MVSTHINKRQSLHASLVGFLLEGTAGRFQLVARGLYVRGRHGHVPKAVPFLVAGMIRRRIVVFRAMIVREFQRDSLVGPQKVVRRLRAGRQMVGLVVIVEGGQKVETKLVLRKIERVNQSHSEQVLVKVQTLDRIPNAEHGLVPGGPAGHRQGGCAGGAHVDGRGDRSTSSSPQKSLATLGQSRESRCWAKGESRFAQKSEHEPQHDAVDLHCPVTKKIS